MRKRTEIRLTPQERRLVEAVAAYFDWKISEVMRRSLRFGLNALLKFETNKKMDLKALEKSLDPIDDDHKNDTTDEITEEMIKIANTKWLDEEDK